MTFRNNWQMASRGLWEVELHCSIILVEKRESLHVNKAFDGPE